MTPKEKAKELVNKFYVILMKKNYPNVAQMGAAKECALLSVDEIIESRKEDNGFNDTLLSVSEYWTAHPMYLTYWQEVKQEIEKL